VNKEFLDYVTHLPAVDAHEHLRLEEVRLKKKPDAIWLFHQYANADLRSAGMSEATLAEVMDTARPLDLRWKKFKPFFERIRHTGYSMAVLYALRDLYGCERLEDGTIRSVSERILAENKPGMIDRFLRQKGRITHILNANYQTEQPTPYCSAVMPFFFLTATLPHNPAAWVKELETVSGAPVTDAASCVEAIVALFRRYAAQRVVALKMISFAWPAGSRSDADAALRKIREGKSLSRDEAFLSSSFLMAESLKRVPEFGFTVVAHCGYSSGVNYPFDGANVRNMWPLMQANPEVRFDLLHLNYPWVDEAIATAKAYTNAHLNLAWLPILNPAVAERVVAEIVHCVPANKVLALGGDYWELPDVAYGHLLLGRETLARGLDRCVEAGTLTYSEARRVAEMWLSENAFETYPLLK